MAAISPELRPIFCEALELASEEERRPTSTGRARATRTSGLASMPCCSPTTTWASSSSSRFHPPASPWTLPAPSRLRAQSSAPISSWSRSAKGALAWCSSPSSSSRSPEGGAQGHQAGHGSRQVIARFEAERQALALMDHPEHRRGARCRELPSRAGLTSSWSWSAACRSPITAIRTSSHRASGWGYLCSLPRDPACPSERHHSPRRQTLQCAGHLARRQAGGEGH